MVCQTASVQCSLSLSLFSVSVALRQKSATTAAEADGGSLLPLCPLLLLFFCSLRLHLGDHAYNANDENITAAKPASSPMSASFLTSWWLSGEAAHFGLPASCRACVLPSRASTCSACGLPFQQRTFPAVSLSLVSCMNWRAPIVITPQFLTPHSKKLLPHHLLLHTLGVLGRNAKSN